MLKHLKTLQHVSIIIQIIFRELVGSLLCGSIKFDVCVWRARHEHTSNVMLPHHHSRTITFFKKIFNSMTLTRNLRAPWRWSE